MAVVAFDKLADDVTKGGERQVNLSCLLKPITCGMRLTLPLRTSQIDQVKLACLDALLALIILFSSFNIYCKNRMTPRTILVHGRLARLPIRVTLFHVFFNLRNCLHNACCQILNINSLILALLEVELAVDCFREEVADLLVINFKVRTSDQELLPYVIDIIQVSKDVIEGVGDDSTLRIVTLNTDHRMRFTATCLPVGEYCAVVA